MFVRGTQRRFPPKYIDNTFWLSKALLDLYKCILSGAMKIFIFSIIPGERESFQITRASVYYFPENFKILIFLITLPITFSSEIVGFLSTKNSLAWGVKCEKFNVRKS